MKLRDTILVSFGAIITISVGASAFALISEQSLTDSQKCHRFWMTKAAAAECQGKLDDAELAEDMQRSNEAAAAVDQGERNREDVQAMIFALARQAPPAHR
jgi:hypothetical protein